MVIYFKGPYLISYAFFVICIFDRYDIMYGLSIGVISFDIGCPLEVKFKVTDVESVKAQNFVGMSARRNYITLRRALLFFKSERSCPYES